MTDNKKYTILKTLHQIKGIKKRNPKQINFVVSRRSFSFIYSTLLICYEVL